MARSDCLCNWGEGAGVRRQGGRGGQHRGNDAKEI